MPTVAFGQDDIYFELDPGDVLTEAEPADRSTLWDPERFRNRLETSGFAEFLRLGKPLVVVNDAFRPTPTGQVLAHLKTWYPEFTADFIVACGNHPIPSPEDVARIFAGYERGADEQLFFHDSRDPDSMTPVGEIEGQPVLINARLLDYPAVLTIGSVEPHYFAGFTGGRKSLVPGLTDIETNRRNHALAVSPEARPLRLDGNPVAEDLDRIVALVKLPALTSIQIIAGRDQAIVDCFAGSLDYAFRQAVVVAEDVFTFRARKRFDLVIAEMRPPLDRNLYQLQKALENCAPAVNDGGTIVAVSRCGEGIGNDEFYQLAGHLEDEEMVLSQAELEHPPLGIHKLSRVIRMSRRIQVKALTGIKQEILEEVFIEPAVSIDAEIQKLKQGDKEHIDILLVRDAGLMVAKLDFQ